MRQEEKQPHGIQLTEKLVRQQMESIAEMIQTVIDALPELSLMDDNVCRLAFSGPYRLQLCEEIIFHTLEIRESIVHCDAQFHLISGLFVKEGVCDVRCVSACQNEYVFEFHNGNEPLEWLEKRMHFYFRVSVTNHARKGMDYRSLPNICVMLFTEKDKFKDRSAPIRIIHGARGQPLFVYANHEVQDHSTFANYFNGFFQSVPDPEQWPLLYEVLHKIRSKEELDMVTIQLTEKMKRVLELTQQEAQEYGLAQGIPIGEKQGISKFQELLRRRLASSQADAIPEDVKEWLLSPEKEDMN